MEYFTFLVQDKGSFWKQVDDKISELELESSLGPNLRLDAWAE